MKLIKLEDVNFKILKDFSIDFRKDSKILDLIVLAGVNGSGNLFNIFQQLKTFLIFLKNSNFFETQN